MAYIFSIAANVVAVYSFLCFVRILLTWIPGLNYSGFGRFLSGLCDPFLNLFSGIKFLHIGALDLSPFLALGVLSMLNIMLQSLAASGVITVSLFVCLLVDMVWKIIAAVLFLLLIFLIVRLIVHLMGTDGGSLWYQIDMSLNPFVYSISKFFSAGKPVAYKTALIVAIIALVVLRFGGQIAFNGIMRICAMIPF